MLDDLMNPSGSDFKKTNKTVKKIVTFSHDESTKKLLTDLVWLKQFVLERKPVSQGDIIRAGLDLLAKKMGYEKLRAEYASELDQYKPSVGRKK